MPRQAYSVGDAYSVLGIKTSHLNTSAKFLSLSAIISGELGGYY